jgi:hypothetical protein
MTATEDIKQTNYRNVMRELDQVLENNSGATLVKLGNWIKAVDASGLEMTKAIGAEVVKVVKWGETFRYRDFLKL